MDKQISSGLKTTFIVHFIVGLIFGLTGLLIPSTWSMFGLPMTEIHMYRLVGAAILGYTASSWFGYQAKTWGEVRIVVIAEMVWTALAALVFLYGLLFAGLPAMMWINVIIMGGFFAAFTYFYTR